MESEKFTVRAGQTWKVTNANGVDVSVKILDMCVKEFFGKLKLCYEIEYTFGGVTEKQTAFDDLHEQLKDGWILQA